MSKHSMFDTLFVAKLDARVYPGFDWMSDKEVRYGYSIIIIDEDKNPFKDYDGSMHAAPDVRLLSIVKHETVSHKYIPDLHRFVDDGDQTDMFATFELEDSDGITKDTFEREIVDFIEN